MTSLYERWLHRAFLLLSAYQLKNPAESTFNRVLYVVKMIPSSKFELQFLKHLTSIF